MNRCAYAILGILWIIGCSTDEAEGAGAGGALAAGAGGAGASAAGGGSSGAAAAGRPAAGAGGASGSVAPPSSGGAGAGASAGTSGIGAAGTAGGAGAAGSAGSAAGSGGATVEHVPVPSAGCGHAGRPSGGFVTVAGSHIYSFPPDYDGDTPMPLIIAFHAAGNPNEQLRNITKGSALEQHFVMAFPKSKGNGWVLNTDSPSIDARHADLVQNYCIDTSRVLATGHSSGAQLIVQLMCRGDDRFAAIAPVASSQYCLSWSDPIPALIIHGKNDRERANTNQDANGLKDLAPYLTSNDCRTDAQPHAQAACSSGGTQVDPGCVEYQGCAEPTIWCHHDDPQYSNTNHGWPCFANAAIDAFFSRLR